MVSTPLKNISQNGNLPQIGVKIKNIWNHHLDQYDPYIFSMKMYTTPLPHKPLNPRGRITENPTQHNALPSKTQQFSKQQLSKTTILRLPLLILLIVQLILILYFSNIVLHVLHPGRFMQKGRKSFFRKSPGFRDRKETKSNGTEGTKLEPQCRSPKRDTSVEMSWQHIRG